MFEFRKPGGTATAEPPPAAAPPAPSARDKVYHFLNGTLRDVPTICAGTGLDESTVGTALITLKLEGAAICDDGGDRWGRKDCQPAAPPPPPPAAPVDEVAKLRAELAEARAQLASRSAPSAPPAVTPETAPPFGEHVIKTTSTGTVYTFKQELGRFESMGNVYVVGLESYTPAKSRGKRAPAPRAAISVRHIYIDRDGQPALDQRGLFWETVRQLRNESWQAAAQAAVAAACSLPSID